MYSYNNLHTLANTRHKSSLEHPVDKHSQKQFNSGLDRLSLPTTPTQKWLRWTWQCRACKIHAPGALQGGNDRL